MQRCEEKVTLITTVPRAKKYLNLCLQHEQRGHTDVPSAMQATPGVKQTLLVEDFTMECLDAFLQSSLHVLLGVKNGSLAVMCAVA